MDWNRFRTLVDADPLLARHAGGATFRVLLGIGETQCLIEVHEGRIASLSEGPFVMPRCDFALSGSRAAWQRFAQPRPAPGDQDLFAYFRRGEIALAGDTRKFYAHLLWLKLMLARLRDSGDAA